MPEVVYDTRNYVEIKFNYKWGSNDTVLCGFFSDPDCVFKWKEDPDEATGQYLTIDRYIANTDGGIKVYIGVLYNDNCEALYTLDLEERFILDAHASSDTVYANITIGSDATDITVGLYAEGFTLVGSLVNLSRGSYSSLEIPGEIGVYSWYEVIIKKGNEEVASKEI